MTHIWRGNCIAVPRHAEHAVAAGVDDEVVRALLARVVWDDVFDASVAAVSPGYPCRAFADRVVSLVCRDVIEDQARHTL